MSLESVRLKGLVFSFKEIAKNAKEKAEIGTKGKKRTSESVDITFEKLSNLTPRGTILNAWSRLEQVAIKKYKELSRRFDRDEVSPREALGFFESNNALTPNAEESLRDIRWLHKQIGHPYDQYISNADAQEYVDATNSLIAQIDSMSDTPAVNLGCFTFLVEQYIRLLDKGICADLTVDDVISRVDDGTILRFLESQAKKSDETINFDFISKFDADEQPIEQYYVRYLQAICEGSGARGGVENKGLHLLIIWTIMILEQGGGWVPRANVAGLHD